MRKTSLAKRNALLSPSGASAGILGLGLVLALVLVRLVAPGAFLAVTMPLVRAGSAFSEGTHSFFSSFADASSLSAENDRLRSENATLGAENRALSDQVDSLTALLGGAAKPAQGIAASVLARPPVSPYDSLVLDRGSDDGVALGMEAFAAGAVPIGSVSSVTGSFSRITLFSAPGETLAAWVGSRHTPLFLSGAGAGAFNATVLRSAGINEGDAVYAPGPGALPVGVVKQIAGEASSPSVTLRIQPAVNPLTITAVVLRDNGGALLGALTCATTTP